MINRSASFRPKLRFGRMRATTSEPQIYSSKSTEVRQASSMIIASIFGGTHASQARAEPPSQLRLGAEGSSHHVDRDEAHGFNVRDLLATEQKILDVEHHGVSEMVEGLLVGAALGVAALEFRASGP